MPVFLCVEDTIGIGRQCGEFPVPCDHKESDAGRLFYRREFKVEHLFEKEILKRFEFLELRRNRLVCTIQQLRSDRDLWMD